MFSGIVSPNHNGMAEVYAVGSILRKPGRDGRSTRDNCFFIEAPTSFHEYPSRERRFLKV